jgi:predicted enzyme related to lactoylglutathione lyase
MTGDPVWLELPGGVDCRRTGTFYARVFGWLVEDDDGMVRFRTPSGSLAGAFVGAIPATGDGPLLYLESDDAGSTVELATAHGGVIVLAPTSIAPGIGHRALLRDPAGSTIGVFEPGSGDAMNPDERVSDH